MYITNLNSLDMKHIHIIAVLFLAFVSMTSCAIDELEYPVTGSESSDAITVIGHISRFADCDVDTKAAKNEEEVKISSMAIAIFPVKADGSGLNGGCVYYEYVYKPSQLTFALERGSKYTRNQRYALYVFANMGGLDGFSVGTELDEILDNTVATVKNQNIPADGFPMIGSLGDTFSTRIDQDGNALILAPDANNDQDLETPKVTNSEGVSELQVLSISMKALFAKVNFSIKVNPNMTAEGKDPPQFTIKGYKIVNVPSSVDFDKTTNASDSGSDIGTLTDIEVNRTGTAMGNNTIDFLFYLPENLLEPVTDTLEYEYPFKGTYNTQEDKNQDGIREEDEILRQRYKSKLLGSDQKATNVVIIGQFRDHQGHFHDVEYTIHLGKDSYGDFNICRNTEYYNYITIRDIKNSSDGQGDLSIDHRVNIERSQPAIISLRRELLLDSHFEIRPLRIRKSGVNAEGINAVRVTVDNNTNWMRLERSFGNGTAPGASGVYITDLESSSYGKRKYFTTDLVTRSLVRSSRVVVPIDEDGECVWIYVDECTEPGDGVRSGVIEVEYGNQSGDLFTPANNPDYPNVSYTINQRKLFSVTFDNGTDSNPDDDHKYYIEYEEEYLHNFDADANFGEDNTEYEGMVWGLVGESISSKYPSVFITEASSNIIASIINSLSKGNDEVKYDFYLERDRRNVSNDNSEIRADRNGYAFCNEIIASQGNDMLYLDLASKPQSAVEYCYNKNKRNADGSVAEVKWYLPAIDEVEEIMKSKYTIDNVSYYTWSRFQDFQNKFYWSSMPAYESNLIDYDVTALGFIRETAKGQFYRDDVDRARATKVDYKGKKIENGVEIDVFDVPASGVNEGYFTNTLYVREIDRIQPVYKFDPITFRPGPGNGNPRVSGLYYEGETSDYYQSGNKSRSDMARVRCVRKMN